MKDFLFNQASPARPILMLRFRIGQESGEIWERTLEQLKRFPNCCDEVWFSTGLGVAPLSTHKRLSETMGRNAAELRKLGIVPSLQFQSTIGHGDGINASRDNSGLQWGTYVGKHGEKCKYINCPRQPGFIRYLEEMAHLYGAWHPGSVWVDDDLRLNNHSPAMDPGGCYCADCLKAFSEREGKEYTREELVSACEQDLELEKRWLLFGQESLKMDAEAIARGFKEISPETRLGLQHNSLPDRFALFQTFSEISGKRCGSRPGGGAYSDHDPYLFMDKAFEMAYMKREQPGYDVLDQVCAEIEDCPRVFSSKTPQGLRIETLFYMATGMDSISYFIMDPLLETPEWYGKELLAPLAAEAVAYHDFAKHNEGTEPGGVGFTGRYYYVGPLAFPLIGVPVAVYSPNACCKMLRAEVVPYLAENELTELLNGNVVLDGAAVDAVCKRGFSGLIGNIQAKTAVCSSEYLTDDPLNNGIAVRLHSAPGAYEISIPGNVADESAVRILGRYKNRLGEDCGIASLLMERANGTRILVLGCGGFETAHISSSRVQFLYRAMDALSGGKMPVLPCEPVQCCIVPRILPDNTLRSVTIMNTVIMKQRPFELQLRGVPGNVTEIEWVIPAEKSVRLPLRRTEDGCFVTVPAIAGWDIGYLKIS